MLPLTTVFLWNWPHTTFFQMVHSGTFQNGQEFTMDKLHEVLRVSTIKDPIGPDTLCHLELDFMGKLS